ncbi:hypothetical protein [Micromonospora sp. NPDC049891]|uniref:hypothetical protein n=1 Tax=Micromonospora sp. NPDC049891 TaxID=3155655 RepID=UPI003402FC33
MTYLIELFDEPGHLIGTHVTSAVDGLDAQAVARADVAAQGACFAEVHQSDGCGGHVFYATVSAASTF